MIPFSLAIVHNKLGEIPLQNVVNFCCPLGSVPTVEGATKAKAEPPMQPLSNKNKSIAN